MTGFFRLCISSLFAAVILLLSTSANHALAESSSIGSDLDWCRPLFDLPAPPTWAESDSSCPFYGPCDDPTARDSWLPLDTSVIMHIRTVIHIVRTDDGLQSPDSLNQVHEFMSLVNDIYRPSCIQFDYEVDYIDSTVWFDLTQTELVAMMAKKSWYSVEYLNVWLAWSTSMNVASALMPWEDAFIARWKMVWVSGDMWHYGGAKTLAHEFGHSLGLWHKHHGVEEVDACGVCYESPGADNRDVVGDFCSDTPPAPHAYSCEPLTSTDPCSGLEWGDIMPENIMGTALHECRNSFTPQQAARMFCWTTAAYPGRINAVNFEPDVRIGVLPLTVAMQSEPLQPISSWTWDFGDGTISTDADPIHTYTVPGAYTVSVVVEGALGTFTEESESIIVHGDTVRIGSTTTLGSETARIDVYSRNQIALREFYMPLSYDGPMQLALDSISYNWSRIDTLGMFTLVDHDTDNRRLTVQAHNNYPGIRDIMPPGSGLLMSLYFTVPDGVEQLTNSVMAADYSSYSLESICSKGSYRPYDSPGVVIYDCCQGIRGNVDADPEDMVDLGDLTALIDHLFVGFTVPDCLGEANVDGDPGGLVDLGDLTVLIDYLFISFTPPAPCY
jgi:hypothetical protein